MFFCLCVSALYINVAAARSSYALHLITVANRGLFSRGSRESFRSASTSCTLLVASCKLRFVPAKKPKRISLTQLNFTATIPAVKAATAANRRRNSFFACIQHVAKHLAGSCSESGWWKSGWHFSPEPKLATHTHTHAKSHSQWQTHVLQNADDLNFQRINTFYAK